MKNFDRGIELAERGMELNKMHERAVKYLREEAVRPEDFHDYDRTVISEDDAYVRAMKEAFERNETPEDREAKQIADTLEAIVLEFGEQGYWFGGEDEDVTTLKTAEYDDIKNGVDIIVEAYRKDGNGGGSELGLAIDVTYRKDLVAKMERIRDEVRSGKLSTVRYFYSPHRDERRQSSIPRVVAGISAEHAMELGRLWMAQKNKQLSEHPVQIVFLEEMEAQLSAFLVIAEREGRSHAKRAIADALATVRKTLDEKDDFIEEHQEEIRNYKLNDPVYALLMESVRSIAK